MKKFCGLVATTVLLGMAGSANAADMPVKAPIIAPAAVAYSWTGCYVGANVGGTWKRQTASIPTNITTNQGAVSADQNAGSVVGGFQLGCNYQFDPHWVVGIEGDWSWADLNATGSGPNLFASGAPTGSGGVSWSSNTRWFYSVRGRAGYLVRPNTLLYVTGGAAWARTDYASLDQFIGGCPNCTAVAFSSTKPGFVVGGGAEYALTAHWLLRGEYLFYRFQGDRFVAPDNTAFTWSDLDVHELRAAVSYKF